MDEPLVVSIGTTHPWNIAGVGLDARIAAEYGCAHAVVVVAVSAQDARGVHALATVDPHVIRAQFESLPPGIAALRIGALVSGENARLVAELVRKRADGAAVVVDPVVRATLGGSLVNDADLPRAICEQLVPLGAILTPNLAEAEALLGMRVHDEASMAAAGRRFVELGAAGAVVTGGHLDGDPVDVVAEAGRTQRLAGPRLPGSMRGSGCTFAAALACELARQQPLQIAAARAHAYVREKIAAGIVRGGLQVAF